MSKKKQSTEAPTKRSLSKAVKKKKDSGKKCSAETFTKKDDDPKEETVGLRTCEETDGGTPTSTKLRKKKGKKKDSKEGTKDDGKDDETSKAKKNKDKTTVKEEESTKKAAKRKRGSKSGKRTKEEEPPPAPTASNPASAWGATVFEPVHAKVRPANAEDKELNKNIKEDIERLEKEEKKAKEKEKEAKEKDKDKDKIKETSPIDEFAPTKFEQIHAPVQPALASAKIKKQPKQIICPASESEAAIPSLIEKKPLYLTIPKEEKSGVAAADQPESDCKTAVMPPGGVKSPQYHMVMYKGVPRFEPIMTKSGRQLERSDKEVAGKIEILPPGEDPAKAMTPPASSVPALVPANTSSSKESSKPVIGTLPKDDSQPNGSGSDGLAPVSQYIAPYGK